MWWRKSKIFDMGRSKLDKFRDNEKSDLIIQPGKDIYSKIKGNWKSVYFRNQNPIVLELACGRGEYATGMAGLFPERNYIGIDIKGPRIWRGMKNAENEGLRNVGFLRGHIQNLEDYFAENEVNEIWITFPDPRPKGRDERRRLTHERFLETYRRILKCPGYVYLKTDNTGLFEYTLEKLRLTKGVTHLVYTFDLYASDLLQEHYGIKTTYEKRYLEQGIKIKYLKFRMNEVA